MARTRLVNPNAPMDEDVATMSLAARYAWAYLPCHADREGRLRDSSFFLRAQIFPGEAIDMEAVLAELAERRHIIRYKADGRSYIQIRSFLRHQAPHTREVKSEIPPPPEEGEPKHDLGGAKVSFGDEELRRVASSPSCPDPVPDPVLLSPDPSGQEPVLASDPDPDQTRSEECAEIWGVYAWRRRYGAAWCEIYGGTAIGGDSSADAKMEDHLAALTSAQRVAAQERATEMFREFLAETGEPAKQRHRWSWFVGRWNALRVPMVMSRAGPARDVTVGHAMAEVKPRATGIQKL